MFADKFRLLYFVWLISTAIISTDALSGSRRRRPVVNSAKEATEDVTEKAEGVPDQIALAASRSETSSQHRRGATYPSNDYTYGNLEMNLIRPESKPIHTQITAKYTSTISTRPREQSLVLDNAETAEEYVAKAMQMYGARLREPIRITGGETEQTQATQTAQQQQQQDGGRAADVVKSRVNDNSPVVFEVRSKQQQQQQDQQQQQEQQQQQHSSLQQYQLQQYQQQQYQTHQQQLQQAQLAANALLAAQMQVTQAQSLESQTERIGQAEPQENNLPIPAQYAAAPAPVFEPVTRSYDVGGEEQSSAAAGGDENRPDDIDRYYRPKYVYQSQTSPTSSYRVKETYEEPVSIRRPLEEKLRVSASTEIPKAEIMKQIEKSVIKYMKELEAEGKIITAPQEPKAIYKLVTSQPTEEKRLATTTIRPKYTTTSTYHPPVSGIQKSALTGGSYGASGSRPQAAKLVGRPQYLGGSDDGYPQSTHEQQQPPQQGTESLSPNVEFVYKIKTRTPLQTATVKTVSKPYTLPLKSGSYDQFDHSAALKNLEDFDLSHAVSGQEQEDGTAGTGSRPDKLYFNSEIYSDINSLPYKSEKSRQLAAEYHKARAAAAELLPDYKGYSGYYAEPATAVESEREQASASDAGSSSSDDGYPLLNPYKYVLKREQPQRYELEHARHHAKQQQQQYQQPSAYTGNSGQKLLDFDSYSPKFNNNPEGYGYQHTYKVHTSADSSPKYQTVRHIVGGAGSGGGAKRGKRGGGAHPHASVSAAGKKGGSTRVHVKDVEANLALRPPPPNA